MCYLNLHKNVIEIFVGPFLDMAPSHLFWCEHFQIEKIIKKFKKANQTFTYSVNFHFHKWCVTWTQRNILLFQPYNIFLIQHSSIHCYVNTFIKRKSLKSWFLAPFWKMNTKKNSILIICNFGHYSYFKLFLNVAQYTLVVISWTSAWTLF